MKVFIYNFPVSYRKRLESDLKKIRPGVKIEFLCKGRGRKRIEVSSSLPFPDCIVEEEALAARIPEYWKVSKIAGEKKRFSLVIPSSKRKYRRKKRALARR